MSLRKERKWTLWPNNFETIGLGVALPSHDLSSLDYILWGSMESIVHDTPVTSGMGLVSGISIAVATINDLPCLRKSIFKNVLYSISHRCQVWIHANWRNFEQILMLVSHTLFSNVVYESVIHRFLYCGFIVCLGNFISWRTRFRPCFPI